MFPNGWPGRGLLLLRIVAGILPIYDGIARLMGAAPHESVALQIIAASAGVFLLAGFWTPIAGALLAVTNIWIALSGTAHLRSSILLATMGSRDRNPGTWRSGRSMLSFLAGSVSTFECARVVRVVFNPL